MTENYSLRNEPEKTFSIEAEGKGRGKKGSLIKAKITRWDTLEFRYEVKFEGPFAETKGNFTTEMYLLTALNVVKSQLESHVHRDTRIVISDASGLMHSEPNAKLDWD